MVTKKKNFKMRFLKVSKKKRLFYFFQKNIFYNFLKIQILRIFKFIIINGNKKEKYKNKILKSFEKKKGYFTFLKKKF